MTWIRVINGKKYNYKSVKKNGKVRSVYLGPHKEEDILLYIVTFGVIIVLCCLWTFYKLLIS